MTSTPPAEVRARFQHQAPDSITAECHAEARSIVLGALDALWEVTPGGEQRKNMVRSLEEALMWSNKAIALAGAGVLTVEHPAVVTP